MYANTLVALSLADAHVSLGGGHENDTKTELSFAEELEEVKQFHPRVFFGLLLVAFLVFILFIIILCCLCCFCFCSCCCCLFKSAQGSGDSQGEHEKETSEKIKKYFLIKVNKSTKQPRISGSCNFDQQGIAQRNAHEFE